MLHLSHCQLCFLELLCPAIWPPPVSMPQLEGIELVIKPYVLHTQLQKSLLFHLFQLPEVLRERADLKHLRQKPLKHNTQQMRQWQMKWM